MKNIHENIQKFSVYSFQIYGTEVFWNSKLFIEKILQFKR